MKHVKLTADKINSDEIGVCAFHDTFRPDASCMTHIETDICGKTFKYETRFWGGSIQGHSCKGRKIDMCNCPIWHGKDK